MQNVHWMSALYIKSIIHFSHNAHIHVCVQMILTINRNPYGKKTYHKRSTIYHFSLALSLSPLFLQIVISIVHDSIWYYRGMEHAEYEREIERKNATLEMTLIDLMSIKQKVDIYTRGYKIADALSSRQLISEKICWTFLQANFSSRSHNSNIIRTAVKCNICTKTYQM